MSITAAINNKEPFSNIKTFFMANTSKAERLCKMIPDIKKTLRATY